MKIQHKRSNQLDGGLAKQPTSEFMEYGELAVNFNETDPAIFLKDSNDNIVRIAGAGANGNIEIPGAGSDPHQPGTSDDRYVEVTGDTMTGQLTLPGGGSGAEAIQVQEVEALINASDTGAGKYVEVAGDNMTGDLTLGTDKITLDASDGSAEFAGRISGNGECFLGDNNSDPRGYLKIVNNSTNEDDDAIRITDTANNNVAKVRVDGSAEFSGRVLCGTSINPNLGTGSWLQDNGGIYTTRPAGSSDAAFTAYQQGGADSPTVEINADGNATFAGDVEIGDFAGNAGLQLNALGAIFCDRNRGTNGLWYGKLNGNTTSSILGRRQRRVCINNRSWRQLD